MGRPAAAVLNRCVSDVSVRKDLGVLKERAWKMKRRTIIDGHRDTILRRPVNDLTYDHIPPRVGR
jgi:hypothetical protein